MDRLTLLFVAVIICSIDVAYGYQDRGDSAQTIAIIVLAVSLVVVVMISCICCCCFCCSCCPGYRSYHPAQPGAIFPPMTAGYPFVTSGGYNHIVNVPSQQQELLPQVRSYAEETETLG